MFTARLLVLKGNTKTLMSDDGEDESSIRRACSLSDLSMGKGNTKRQLEIFSFVEISRCFPRTACDH